MKRSIPLERLPVGRTVWLLLLATVLSAIAWSTPVTAGELDRESGPTSFGTAVEERCNSETTFGLFRYPSCIVSVVLDPRLETSWSVSLTILGIFFAILVRQAVQGYVEGPLVAFVLFVLVLIGTIVVGSDGEARRDTGWRPLDDWYVLHVLFSALAAGVLSFWTRYAWDLLPVVVVAGIVAAIVLREDVLPTPVLELPSIAVGAIGGAWLFWRSARRKRVGDGSAQAVSGQSASSRSGSAPSNTDGGAGRANPADGG